MHALLHSSRQMAEGINYLYRLLYVRTRPYVRTAAALKYKLAPQTAKIAMLCAMYVRRYELTKEKKTVHNSVIEHLAYYWQ